MKGDAINNVKGLDVRSDPKVEESKETTSARNLIAKEFKSD